MKKLTLTALMLWACSMLSAQIPSGYYDNANGKKGTSLKTALCGIIYDHTKLTYDYIWTAFYTTDKRSDGYVWDMYSTANFTFGTDQAGNYQKEGDKYNREHSFPKSWFSDKSPMVTDLMHIVPTDGYVNGRRGNSPFGETDNPTYTSNGGLSKLGPAKSGLGYSGTVFEPADEYKGDFARIYFYMVTCYEESVSSWSSAMLSGNKYPALSDWAKTMLLRWAKEDPVSEKEIKRNNAVYELQGNRNPFVDYEGLEQYIWGDLSSTSVDLDNYTSPYGSASTSLSEPYFSISSGSAVTSGTSVAIGCRTSGATIHYTTDGGSTWQSSSTSVVLTITEATSIQAYSTYESQTSSTVSASYTIAQSGSGTQTGNSNYYQKVTSASQLVEGKKYVIFCPSKNVTMTSTVTGSALAKVETTLTDDGYIDVSALSNVAILTLGGSTGSWTLKMNDVNYLSWSSGNSLTTSSTATSNNQLWTITASESSTTISNKNTSGRKLQYNSSSPRFACYTTSQTSVQLYVQMEAGSSDDITSVAAPEFTPAGGTMAKGSTATITSSTSGATIYYNLSGNTEQTGTSPVTITLNNPGVYEYSAYAKYNELSSDVNYATFEVNPAIPTVSPEASTYTDSQSFEITTSEEGVNLYYTTDGSTPDENSTHYTGSVSLPLGTTTVKAIAEIDGLVSDVIERTYQVIPSSPAFSLTSGTYSAPIVVTLSSSLENGTIYYTTDGSTPTTESLEYSGEITLNSTTTLKAIIVKDGVSSNVAEATYTIKSGNMVSTGRYIKITSTDDLEVGANYLIVYEDGSKALGAYVNNKNKPYYSVVDVTITENVIDLNDIESMPTILTLGGESGAYTFEIKDESVYLSCPSETKNYLDRSSSHSDDTSIWTIIVDETNATITNKKYTARFINYNKQDTRFSTYKSTSNQQAVCLYKEELKENIPSVITILIGDVNLDDEVNVEDVTTIVNYILGSNPATFSNDAADINEDNEVNVDDVVDLIDRILNGNISETREVNSN